MFWGGFGGILLRYHGIKWKLRFCVCWPAQKRLRLAAKNKKGGIRHEHHRA